MWTMINDYRIEKSRLPVVLITAEGERVSGDLFVQTISRHHPGQETAPDILNSHERYFPIACLDGRTLLLSKDHVREVFVAREDIEQPEWQMGTAAEVDVRVVGGARHAGTILIEQMSGRQRALDFLNRFDDRFLPLYSDAGVTLLNCAHITHVTQVA
jgi:hypothetical protein